MAEDLKLEIVIQALLDAQGFEQAKQNIDELGATANRVASPLQKAGQATKVLGDAADDSLDPFEALRKELFGATGVTIAAGKAAEVTSGSLYVMEGAATAANAAISASAIGLALLLPLLIDWFTANKDNEQAQKDFNSQLDISLQQLQEVIDRAPQATKELQALLGVFKAERAKAQTDELAKMREEVVRIDTALGEARGTVERYEQAVSRGFTATYAPAETARQAVKDLTAEKDRLLIKAHEIERALLDGATAGEVADRITKTLTESDREAAKAARERAAELKKLNEIKGKIARGQDEDARLDIIKFTEKEDKKKRKAIQDEIDDLLALGQVKKDQAALDRAIFNEKKVIQQETIGYIGATLSALSSAFGGNKALAIAGAIVDTWAGVARALGPEGPPWPANIAAAASVAAAGLAAVVNIQKAEPVGFDDPFADITARKLGQRSAIDFVRNFGGAFAPGVIAGMGAVGGITNQTTINRGTTINMGGIHGALGPRPAFDKWLERAMTKAERSRRRTTLGR
jgi:hypothetical protein